MNIKILGCFILGMFVSLVSVAGKSEQRPNNYKYSRPIPISLGYFKEFTTNQSVSNFHVALEKNSGWVFDAGHNWLKPQQVWTRVAYKYLIYPIVSAPFYKALRMSSDAYGQASRIQALGGRTRYVGNTYETYAACYWQMFLANLWKSYKGAVTGSVEEIDVLPTTKEAFTSDFRDAFVSGRVVANTTAIKAKVKVLRENDAVDANKVVLNDEVRALRDSLDGYLTARGKVLVRAAGYNARMEHTRNIEDTLWYDGGGHLAQLSNHTMNKLAHTVDSIGIFFQRNESGQKNSELGRIEEAYKDMGIELTWKEMGIYGAVAFLGSAEFWGRFLEEVDYISSGDAYVKAPEIHGFRLPNLGFYLTTQGPSYQINTGYRFGQDLFFPLAVEFVFKGPNKMVELTAGVRKHFAWMGAYLHGEITANPHTAAFGGKLAVGIKPIGDMFADVGVQIDHIDTLRGERNIRSLKEDKWCPSVYATVGVLF